MKTIFWDEDTQRDFMDANGALYVSDAESIKPNLLRLTDYARQNNIFVLGSVDRHFGTKEFSDVESELSRNGGPFPDHCMDGTTGQWRIYQTILSRAPSIGSLDGYSTAFYIPNFSGSEIDDELINEGLKKLNELPQRGIYFEKQNYDVFSNPNVKPFLERAKVSSAIVYGVATDYCVKAAVLGMQNLGIQTYVVSDAIKGVFPESTKKALEEMVQAGAKLVSTDDVIAGLETKLRRF